MQEFTITIKTFCRADGPAVFDRPLLDAVLARHGCRLRDAEQEYADTGMYHLATGVYCVDSDLVHITVDAPSGEAAQAVAAALEPEGVFHVRHADGSRGGWIAWASVDCSRPVGPAAAIFDLLTAGGDAT